jgi:hypothetical protein
MISSSGTADGAMLPSSDPTYEVRNGQIKVMTIDVMQELLLKVQKFSRRRDVFGEKMLPPLL